MATAKKANPIPAAGRTKRASKPAAAPETKPAVAPESKPVAKQAKTRSQPVAPTPSPKAATGEPKAKRVKTKVIIRKKLLWGVYSGTMKEEGRFAYADRAAADTRAAELSAKHKKIYFVQPIKEPLGDHVAEAEEEAADAAAEE